MREALDNLEEGIKVGGRRIKAIRFADDQAILSSSNKGLQILMNRLDEVSKDYGMRINVKKTKIMKISKYGGNMKIVINGTELEQVDEYVYLGSLITQDAKCHWEIRRRTAMGKEAFMQRKELLRGNLNINLKKRMVKTLIWPVVLYASETWTIRKEDRKKIEAFEMWVWRRLKKVSWKEKITNEAILEMVEERKSLINTITKSTTELDWTRSPR